MSPPPQSQKAQKASSISGCPFVCCRPTDPGPYDHSPVEERRQRADTAEPRLSLDLPTWQNLSTRQRLEHLQLLSRVFERIDNRARDRHHSAAHDAMYLHLVYNRNMIAKGAQTDR